MLWYRHVFDVDMCPRPKSLVAVPRKICGLLAANATKGSRAVAACTEVLLLAMHHSSNMLTSLKGYPLY